ncbi:stonin 2 [Cichlidogyrus casuarinus]|uniref:Stonin 2 n=1 Tax=Cichlidogyrus casuarinus TaxID=1844966 RepID=A0ABD2Q3U6_9PLAT
MDSEPVEASQIENEVASTSSEEQIDLQDVTYRASSLEVDDEAAFPTTDLNKRSFEEVLEPTDPQHFVEKDNAQPAKVEDEEKYIRPRPEKQNTISGNNPFRNSQEEEVVDAEQYARVFTTTHDEDSDSAAEKKEEEVEGEFDPLGTIYPHESDNDSSSSSWSEDEMKKLKKIRIRDKGAHDQDNGEEKENIMLPAPPKVTTNIAYQEELAPPEDFEEKDNTPKPREETKNPWNEELDGDEERERHQNLLKAFEMTRFMVDWQAPIPKYVPTAIPTGKPVALLPELPREETPDPELDIAFHPAAEEGQVWRLWIRHPEKKSRMKQKSKYTTDRTWKEIGVSLGDDRGRCTVNLHELDEQGGVKEEPYRTVRVEPYMQLSRDKLQQYDKYGKLHIFKLNHVSYREFVGMRPEKFTLKNLQNLVSHKPKQNVALDHIPVYSEILKFGSLDHKPVISLMAALEDRLMLIPTHKDTSLNYTKEEVCCYVVDEYHGKLNIEGIIEEQKARTRIFCTAFVNGGPHLVLGVNDKWRYGREVVRRSEILPIMHDDWISIKKPEFHSCVEMDEYGDDHMIRFFPLDGCRFELMRFRVSLARNLQLPMQVRYLPSS